MPRIPQEIAGLIKGFPTTIVPWLEPLGEGVGGVGPLDSHDWGC